MGLFGKKKGIASIENLSNQGDPRYMREDMAEDIEEQRRKTTEGIKQMSAKQKAYLEKLTPRPQAMKYFDERASYDSPRIKELQEWKAKGGKVVGTLCVFAPNELILASGAKLVRLCSGYYDSQHPANELLGDAGLCPLVKSTLGNKMVKCSPLFELCDLVVAPATCDGKMKLGEILSDFIPVLMLNVPRVKTGDTTSKMWIEEMKYMMYRLEDLTGQKIKRKHLSRVIKQYNRATKVWGALCDTRKQKRVSLWGRDFVLISQLAMMDELDRWCDHVEELTRQVNQMHAAGQFVGRENSPRVIVGGSPIIWPNWKLPNLIEESDGVIIMDELCSSTRMLQDPIIIDEGSRSSMLKAIAERYLYPCTCPCFSPNDERIIRLNNFIKDYALDGMVYHVLRGCHLNNLEASKVDQELRKKHVSMLKIESEYDEGDVEQIRTRVEAFLEMIKSRKEFEREGKKEVEQVKGFQGTMLEDMKGMAEEKRLIATVGQDGKQIQPGQPGALPAAEAFRVGIDVGALYTKMVLLKGTKMIDKMMESTTMDPNALGKEMLDKLIEKNAIKREDIKSVVATGQGKGSIEFADKDATEISAFAKAASYLMEKPRMAIDIGGQGIRIMDLDEEGVMSSFRTNDKCSSGTGTFLDTMAQSLAVDPQEMGPLGSCSSCPADVVATCTIFAESEMVSLVAKQVSKEDIIGGLNKMVAKKVAAIANGMGIKGDVLLAGGVASNENVVNELREKIKHKVVVAEDSQYVGAYGAALLGSV